MFAAILIGGGLTIVFRDEQFIQWKLTIVNGIFALVLLCLHLLGKSPLRTMLESMTAGQNMNISMPEKAWSQITYIFIGFFASVTALNTYITLFMDFNAWVVFKSGLFVVSLVFLPAVLMLFFIKHKAITQTTDQPKSND
jgi:intracellular septation protein